MGSQPKEFALGNPWLPCPHLNGEACNIRSSKNGDTQVNTNAVDTTDPDYKTLHAKIHRVDRKPKKLVVLCDGTGQNSYGSVAKNPTNIARLARALAPNAFVLIKENGKEKYIEWEQLISYHAGVGTFDGNTLLGGMFGEGLSEIVRAAYGFLVSNWNHGDKIYIFGFSRGAYIARALAGLVSKHGLLTKAGMDNFNAVYDTFYAKDSGKGTKEAMIQTADGLISKEEAGLQPVEPGTVEVVGVFDTVGFHSPIKVWLSTHKWTKPIRKAVWGADRDEFANTQLHHSIKFAFHALSLDESRIPFQTTLWWRKKDVPQNEKHKDPITDHEWSTTLKQVWFSGRHSDIGGGMQDTRFSNVTIGWMIAQLESRGLLAFNKDYLMDDSNKTSVSLSTGTTTFSASDNRWQTTEEAAFDSFTTASTGLLEKWQHIKWKSGKGAWALLQLIKKFVVLITGAGRTKLSRWFTGHRKPGEYTPIESYREMSDADAALYDTFEQIHESVLGRNKPGGWKCPPLDGCERIEEKGPDGKVKVFWRKYGRSTGREITFHEHDPTEPDDSVSVRRLAKGIEKMLMGNMRFQPTKKPWLAHKVTLKPDATPVVDPKLLQEVNPPEPR